MAIPTRILRSSEHLKKLCDRDRARQVVGDSEFDSSAAAYKELVQFATASFRPAVRTAAGQGEDARPIFGVRRVLDRRRARLDEVREEECVRGDVDDCP